MPPPVVRPAPTGQVQSFAEGVRLVNWFCRVNGLPVPKIAQPTVWHFGACAFYRPDTDVERRSLENEDGLGRDGYVAGINISLRHCGRACDDSPGRNWSWPGSTTDRTPYGVLAHELGHHADWESGEKKGRYWSETCEAVKAAAGEPGLTSYADENPAEWFAEAFRLFVTNPDLLRQVRPKTFAELADRWKPVRPLDWRFCLGPNVPAKVVRSLVNKGVK